MFQLESPLWPGEAGAESAPTPLLSDLTCTWTGVKARDVRETAGVTFMILIQGKMKFMFLFRYSKKPL